MLENFTFLHRRNKVIDERLESWWGSTPKLLITIGFAVVIIGVTLSHYHDYLGKGTPPTRLVNTLCGPCGSGGPSYCSLPQDYQFSKVIWFITDGYPMYMQKKWLSTYADHAIPFTVAMPGNKWSHSVYTSWFTGMPNVNLLARPVYGDNIFESMRRASGDRCSLTPVQNKAPTGPVDEFSLHWIGPTWCPVDLMGGSERVKNDLNFVEIEAVTEDLDLKQHPYPSISLANLPSLLQSIAEKDQSLIAHTGIIDKEAHYGVDSAASEQFLFDLFAGPAIREFIDSHPEYLLIMSSDHGRSVKHHFHGENNTTKRGNIGMFTFYNPIFHGQNMSEIDVCDVHPTLAKYLKNVDISAYSVGEVRNSYGPGGEHHLLNALKQNLYQLYDLMQRNGDAVNHTAVEEALESNDVDTVRTQVRLFKAQMYNPQIRPFYQCTIAFLVVVIFWCLVYWARKVNTNQHLITLLLAVPLLFSLGFFLKPISTYHFQSNFTFYFGVCTSFLMASVFSGWSVFGYLVLNELFNVFGYLFRNYLSTMAAAPFIGVSLSLAESLYYYSQTQELTPLRRTVVISHLLNFLYLLDLPLLPIYGFDLFGFMIYFFVPATFLVSLAQFLVSLRRGNEMRVPSQLTIALTSVILLLSNCSPLVAILNFQARQILPCLFGKPQLKEEENTRVSAHYGVQACAVYVLQQSVWVTWFVWGIVPDLDIDVKAGVPGIISWNEKPVLAGILLGMQKVGVFPLFALHIGTLIIPNIFPRFLYFVMTLINCLSIHMCFKKFSFKTQIEALLIITLSTFLQFVMTIVLKRGVKQEFEDRSPWALVFMNRVRFVAAKVWGKCMSRKVPARVWHLWSQSARAGYTRLTGSQ